MGEQEGVEAKLRTLLGGELGPTGRRLLGRAFAVMYERGKTIGLHGMIGRCCDALRSKDEGQSPANAKRCVRPRSLACRFVRVWSEPGPPFSHSCPCVCCPHVVQECAGGPRHAVRELWTDGGVQLHGGGAAPRQGCQATRGTCYTCRSQCEVCEGAWSPLLYVRVCCVVPRGSTDVWCSYGEGDGAVL